MLQSLCSHNVPEQLEYGEFVAVSELLARQGRALVVMPPPQVLLQGDQKFQSDHA